MLKFLAAFALLAAVSTSFAATTITATVGHMCCGGCRNAATTGVKKLDWVDAVTINGTAVTVTAKAGQQVEVISLRDALNKAGFPANEMLVSEPVTLEIAHLCCGGCADAVKTALGKVTDANFDKGSITVDMKTKTAVVRPLAGKNMNLITILQQMEQGATSALKGTIGAPKG
ncbi:MAG: cation transporter [Armatimonadota bacterium]